MHKVPTSPKICASSTLGNLKWQDWAINVHFSESSNSHKPGLAVTVSKIFKHSKLHHLYITYLKFPPPARTKISYVNELKRHIKNEWADLNHAVHWMCSWRRGTSVYALVFVWWQTFRAQCKYHVTTTHLTVFETITASCVCGYSTIHQRNPLLMLCILYEKANPYCFLTPTMGRCLLWPESQSDPAPLKDTFFPDVYLCVSS